ncbi:4-alpha-glucanotransferase (plasmid) [Pseudoalteromonas sp. T1lg65]|uniref:4-alpha-glucanotransferase n=1 Tax=Pseudoalteromonas sp. T1lg65 TaxID=2077101 RepID=UPI003F7A8E5E
MDPVSQLLYLYGIGYEYHKYNGEHVVFDHQVRLQALKECGISCDQPSEVISLNYELDVAKWLGYVEPITLVDFERPVLSLRLPAERLPDVVQLWVKEIDYTATIDLCLATTVGNYSFEGCEYIHIEVPIAKLPVGYHNGVVVIDGKQFDTELWVTPSQCFDPVANDEKLVGISIQLYSLRPETNKPCADFFELHTLVEQCAGRSIDYVLLNPLHLLFEDKPERASPYSPNDRRLLNPLYLSFELLAERFPSLQLVLNSKEPELREDGLFVNMTDAVEYKYQGLRNNWSKIQALQADWQPELEKFYQANPELHAALADDEFESFVQWQLFEQLAYCQKVAIESGMKIGLINDLAVGCARDAREYLSNQGLYSHNANVGAPPDPWAEKGQDWGLPAINPVSLKNSHFSFFKQLVRANLSGVGGLRIDHVMGLRRLWWCFSHEGERAGCYVYYPFEHLLAILKIESARAKVMVIGEDLGVVPEEIKTSMHMSHIYSNILFYFEKDHLGRFKHPSQYAKNALLMVANHDVPPFCGWWQAYDLKLKLEYKLCTESEYQAQLSQRQVEKQQMLEWISESGGPQLTVEDHEEAVYSALLICLAHSNAKLLTLQLDDLDKQRVPVNIPGTDLEYPNWRRKLSAPINTIISQSAILIENIVDSRK